MNIKQVEKLEDYINGLMQLRSDRFVLGSISVHKKDATHVLDKLTLNGVSVLHTEEGYEDRLLEILARRLEKKQATAITITNEIPQKFNNQLHNISNGLFNAHIAGHNSPTIINPLLNGAMVILIFIDCDPMSCGVQHILSSTVNI